MIITAKKIGVQRQQVGRWSDAPVHCAGKWTSAELRRSVHLSEGNRRALNKIDGRTENTDWCLWCFSRGFVFGISPGCFFLVFVGVPLFQIFGCSCGFQLLAFSSASRAPTQELHHGSGKGCPMVSEATHSLPHGPRHRTIALVVNADSCVSVVSARNSWLVVVAAWLAVVVGTVNGPGAFNNSARPIIGGGGRDGGNLPGCAR